MDGTSAKLYVFRSQLCSGWKERLEGDSSFAWARCHKLFAAHGMKVLRNLHIWSPSHSLV